MGIITPLAIVQEQTPLFRLGILHPILTNFPIALLITVLFLECFSRWYLREQLRQSALIILCLAILATFLTYLSGYLAVDMIGASFEVHKEVIEAHQLSAKILLFLLIPTAILALSGVKTNSPQRTCYLIMLWCCVVVLSRTAHQGGKLVFSEGIGVHKVDYNVINDE